MTEIEIELLIRQTIEEAELAIKEGNSPFAAIITDSDGKIVAKSHNTQKSSSDPTAHGEINAIRTAGKYFNTNKLAGFKIFINAEPCAMCMTAIIKAFIDEVYYGASQEQTNNPDIRAKEVAARCNYKITLKGGYLASEASKQIQSGRKNMGVSSSQFKD